MLKYAGWDGIAIRGPGRGYTGLDRYSQMITSRYRDARRSLWGLDTWETQQKHMEERYQAQDDL